MFVVDVMSRVPVYEQIIKQVEEQVLTGILKEGDKLPSVRSLSVKLSINPNTIQRAYMTLEQEGLIYPVRGKGNFVAETTRIQEKSKGDFRKEFLELVKKGLQTGVTEEEMLSMVRKNCEEEQR